MAKPVKLAAGKEFTFAQGGSSEASKYPWDEWFSGDLLMLEQSLGDKDEDGSVTKVHAKGKRDFEVPVDAMPPKIKTAARRRYKVVQVSRKDADGKKLDNAVIIKARDMTADERVAEDTLRAEEKIKRETKEAEKKAAASANGTTDGAATGATTAPAAHS